jgi:hypothetical protein
VIEDDQVAAGVRVIEQLLISLDQFRLRFIDAIVDDERSELRQIRSLTSSALSSFRFNARAVSALGRTEVKAAHITDAEISALPEHSRGQSGHFSAS